MGNLRYPSIMSAKIQVIRKNRQPQKKFGLSGKRNIFQPITSWPLNHFQRTRLLTQSNDWHMQIEHCLSLSSRVWKNIPRLGHLYVPGLPTRLKAQMSRGISLLYKESLLRRFVTFQQQDSYTVHVILSPKILNQSTTVIGQQAFLPSSVPDFICSFVSSHLDNSRYSRQ